MIHPVFIALAAGLSLGGILGFHGSRAVVNKVGGPFARKPLVLGCSLAGAVFVMIPAIMVIILFGRNLVARSGQVAEAVSMVVLAGLSLGTAVILTSTVVVGTFSGALCARMIEEARAAR